MQLVDCSILNIETLQYQPRVLVSSFLYILIGKINIISKKIIKLFKKSNNREFPIYIIIFSELFFK